MALPSLYHRMLGAGLPVAVQLRTILSFSFTVLLEGGVVTDGATWLSTTVMYSDRKEQHY